MGYRLQISGRYSIGPFTNKTVTKQTWKSDPKALYFFSLFIVYIFQAVDGGGGGANGSGVGMSEAARTLVAENLSGKKQFWIKS